MQQEFTTTALRWPKLSFEIMIWRPDQSLEAAQMVDFSLDRGSSFISGGRCKNLQPDQSLEAAHFVRIVAQVSFLAAESMTWAVRKLHLAE